VIAVGGDLITNDITHYMHVPFDVAEAVKLQYGNAQQQDASPLDTFLVQPFGEGMPMEVKHSDLAMVINARVSELFELVQAEIKRSGYDGLLRAGVVLTGGCAQLPGIREVAAEVLGIPVRIAKPEKITGMADALRSPAYSTSVGLLRLGLQMESAIQTQAVGNGSMPGVRIGSFLSGLVKRLLPDAEK
jgi:cell division protein FtsA